jgi:hypothetical protein
MQIGISTVSLDFRNQNVQSHTEVGRGGGDGIQFLLLKNYDRFTCHFLLKPQAPVSTFASDSGIKPLQLNEHPVTSSYRLLILDHQEAG